MMAAIVDRFARYGGAIDAVPSIHGDMVFAETVYRSILTEDYDVIALEIPRDIFTGDLVAAVDGLWPAPGLALIKGHTIGTREFPVDGRQRQVAAVKSFIPIAACDSLIAAVRAYSLLRKRGARRLPILEFCDSPGHCGFRRCISRQSMPDSWFVVRNGLDAYLEQHRRRFQDGRLPIDELRESAMAAALRRHLNSGERVMFVCGMAHWHPIVDLLDAGGPTDLRPPEIARRECRTIETFALNAAEAWWLGLMGIPALVASFVDHLESGSAESSFDIPGAVTKLTEKALMQARDVEEQTISVRSCLAFRRYFETKLALQQRWCPELDSDLAYAAETCVHPEFARSMKETALAYPFDPPPQTPAARVARLDDRTYLLAERQAYLLDRNDSPDAAGESRSLPMQEPFPLSQEEARMFGRLPTRRFPLSEDAFQRACIERVWSAGEHRSRLNQRPDVDLRSAPFQGHLGRGIHWRRTLTAHLEGAPEDLFFVKLSTQRMDTVREPEAGSEKEVKPCPVVWVFTPGAAVQSRVSGTFATRVYSSFYWLSASSSIASGCITQERVAFCVNILRGRVRWDREAVRHFLEELPRRFQPTVAPWDDPELIHFVGPDQAVAAGIKYAADRVIVVADSNLVLGRNLQDYAKGMNPKIEIIRISWSVLPWEARRRLALQHMLPSPPFDDPDPRLLSQIPPVPQFNVRWRQGAKRLAGTS